MIRRQAMLFIIFLNLTCLNSLLWFADTLVFHVRYTSIMNSSKCILQTSVEAYNKFKAM